MVKTSKVKEKNLLDLVCVTSLEDEETLKVSTQQKLIAQAQKEYLKRKKEKEMLKTNAVNKNGEVYGNTNGIEGIEAVGKDYTKDKLIDMTKEVEKLNDTLEKYKKMTRGLDDKKKKEFFIDSFEEVEIGVWNAFLIGQIHTLGLQDQVINLSNIDEVYKMYVEISKMKWEQFARTNLATAPTILKAEKLGIKYEFQTEWNLRRLISLKENPVTEKQETDYSTLLVKLGYKLMKISDMVEDMKKNNTTYEAKAKINDLKRQIPCSEGQLAHINSLEIKLSIPCTESMNSLDSTTYCNELKMKWCLKLGAGFKDIKELEEYAKEQAKERFKATNKFTYPNVIVDELIKGLEMDKKANYLIDEETTSRFAERIANTLK